MVEKYCACGCRQVVKNRFISGHNSKLNLRFTTRGTHPTTETRKKLSEAVLKRAALGIKTYGRAVSEETRRKLSKAKKGKLGGMLGKHHSEFAKSKISAAGRSLKNHKHHLYLRSSENDKVLVLPRKLHNTIHREAYDYLLEKFGTIEVDSYWKWFRSRHGISEVLYEKR